MRAALRLLGAARQLQAARGQLLSSLMAAEQLLPAAASWHRAAHSDQVEQMNREMADFFGAPCNLPDPAAAGQEAATPDDISPGAVGSSSGLEPLFDQQQQREAHLQEHREPFAAVAAQQQQLQQLPTPAAQAGATTLQQLAAGVRHLQEQAAAMSQLLADLAAQQQQQQQQRGPAAWPQPPASNPQAQPCSAEQPAEAAEPTSVDGSPFSGAAGPAAAPPPPPRLSHVDASGRASMVDVSGKGATRRAATASAVVLLGAEAYAAVAANALAKGDVLALAQVAGILGAKATPSLVPLCHPLLLSKVDVSCRLLERRHAVAVEATAVAAGPTGVEMEALTAAAVAALTVYDMCKAVSKGIVIERVRLERKEGGKSGGWRRGAEEAAAAAG